MEATATRVALVTGGPGTPKTRRGEGLWREISDAVSRLEEVGVRDLTGLLAKVGDEAKGDDDEQGA